jgi:hypothetical protein
MKRLACLFIAIVSLLACERAGVAAQPIDLFNGMDLSNWKVVLADPLVKKDDVFSVKDRVLVCKGEPMGFIYTDHNFADFKLEVEWRWAPGQTPGNSGVFLRLNGEPRPLPRCIECQLKSGDAGDVYAFHGMKIDGEPARRTEKRGHELGGDLIGFKKLFMNENTPGKWNRLEVELRGYDLTVKVNGRVVNEATRCEFINGPVGLQSEGGEVHFRKVRLTPLQ